MRLFHLYPEGGPAPPMTSSICVFHLGIGLEFDVPSYRTDAAQQRDQAEEVNRRKITTSREKSRNPG